MGYLKFIKFKLMNLFGVNPKAREVFLEIEVKPKRVDYCEFHKCKAKLNMINTYKCKYCRMEFCENHRTPEEHNCSGNPFIPSGMKQGGQRFANGGTQAY